MGKRSKHRNKNKDASAAVQSPAAITMSADELKNVIAEAIVEAAKQKEDFSKYKTTWIISITLSSIFFLIFGLSLIFGIVLLFKISATAAALAKIHILFTGLFLIVISPAFLCAAFEMSKVKDSSYLWGAFASIISLLALIVSIISAAK